MGRKPLTSGSQRHGVTPWGAPGCAVPVGVKLAKLKTTMNNLRCTKFCLEVGTAGYRGATTTSPITRQS